MNLNPIEWCQTQELLVKLVQVLTPLAVRPVPFSLFLARRFVVDPNFLWNDSRSFPLRYPVQLLTTLHSVQKEMEKWSNSAPSLESEGASSAFLSPLKDLKDPEAKKFSASVAVHPLPMQARKLIDQVQAAIGKLASSSYMQDPQEGILRETLKELKPNLDLIIQSVSSEKNQLNPSQHILLKSSREETWNRFRSLTAKEIPAVGEESKPFPKAGLTEKKEKEAFFEKERAEENLETFRLPTSGQSEHSLTSQKRGDVVTLLGAPFTPESKKLILSRKKKKKKGFWSKDDKKDSSDP